MYIEVGGVSFFNSTGDPAISGALSGQLIYNRPEGQLKLFTSGFWRPLSFVVEHNALSGLTADDHVQYLLIDGTRAMTGNLNMGSGRIINVADPILDLDAVNLRTLTGFVDGVSGSIVSGVTNISGFLQIQIDNIRLSGVTDATNVGSGGVGPFFAKVGSILQFKNINSANSTITVTDDIPNKEIDLSVDLSGVASGVAPLIEHGLLSGLLDNDHPQYLLVDGSDFMEGELNASGFRIINVPTPISGLDAVNKDYVDGLSGFVQSGIVGVSGTMVSISGFLQTQIDGAIVSGVNVGSGGVGVFDAKNGTNLEFRNIISDNNTIDIVLDAPNKEIDLSVDISGVASGVAPLIDHGLLSGLLDNDHPQYLLVDGTDFMEGELNASGFRIINVPTPVSGLDAVNKDYVDGLSGFLQSGIVSVSGDLISVSGFLQTQIDGAIVSGVNVGSGGVDIFKQKLGTNLEFRSINSANGTVDVVLDAPNNEVDLSVDLSGVASGVAPLIDHGLLSGLLDNDHPQYLLVDGTDFMEGELNASGFRIINVATPISGLDAVNKDYVDGLSGFLQSGVLAVSGDLISVSGFLQTQITDLETDIIFVSGEMISISGHLQTQIDGAVTSGVNIGSGGVAVFDSKVGTVLNFRSINSPDGTVDVIFDAINKEVDLSVDISGVASGVASLIDHGLLSGLLDDDHPQYLLIDGTREMGGELSASGFRIINVPTPISGLDAVNKDYIDLISGFLGSGITSTSGFLQTQINNISGTVINHASGHLPSGVDPLDTGVPVTIGTANAEGNSNAFSRSNHVHDHGQQSRGDLHDLATVSTSGFMGPEDKQAIVNFQSGAFRAGCVPKASFTGSDPVKATVTFSTPYTDASYSVVATAVTDEDDEHFVVNIFNKASGSFQLVLDDKDDLLEVCWQTMNSGEFI